METSTPPSELPKKLVMRTAGEKLDRILESDKLFEKFMTKVRKDLILYFDREKLADKLVEIVDKSPFVSFTKERDKLTLNRKQPVLKLRINWGILSEDLKSAIQGKSSMIDVKSHIVRVSVVDLFISELIRITKEDPSNNMLKESLPDQEEISTFRYILSSIFVIHTSPDPSSAVILYPYM